MNLNQTITVLEALASGCSPVTGEMIRTESVLQERAVIRALQIAIEHLKSSPSPHHNPEIAIAETDILAAIQLFSEHQVTPTYSALTGFFSAKRAFKSEAITAHELYGKYKNLYPRGRLMDFFTTWLQDNDYSKHGKRISRKAEDKPWKEIDFFQQALFNHYSVEHMEQLKQQINALGLSKSENLAVYIQKARLHYPRSHEPWKTEEDELLWAALQQTNDLNFLSGCFQRGVNAIEERGKRLLYEQQSKTGYK